MATSVVSIGNLALIKLGAAPIVSLSENSKNARAIAGCYETLRDRELRAYPWKFSITRAILAPDAVEPLFQYASAFPVPADFLRLLKPARLGLDWHLENHEGRVCILTNDGTQLHIRYVRRVTDPTVFDPIFVEMLACKIAWHNAEAITQSNTKKAALMDEYRYHRAEARKTNAFEVNKQPQPVDEWLASRNIGQLINTEWDEE